jgi:hypothetical protein
MVKRAKVQDMAAVIEFAGRSKDDPEFLGWLEEHRARNGGKLRVSQGGTGVRVALSNAGDVAWWQTRQKRG